MGGVAKPHNSSQMNLSGSSSSLTSDASTKAGASNHRSFGIGGALLHKRIVLMTRQHSGERSRDRENQSEEVEEERVAQEETAHADVFPLEQRRRRSRQQSSQGAETDAGLLLMRVRAGSPVIHPGSPPRISGIATVTTSLLSQPHITASKPHECPVRTRLVSPFRILRERSQSKERPRAVRTHVNEGEETREETTSTPEGDRRRQTEQRPSRERRSVSPNPFLWLCRDRHSRRKTVWHNSHTYFCWMVV